MTRLLLLIAAVLTLNACEQHKVDEHGVPAPASAKPDSH
jgi:hypothetical protein